LVGLSRRWCRVIESPRNLLVSVHQSVPVVILSCHTACLYLSRTSGALVISKGYATGAVWTYTRRSPIRSEVLRRARGGGLFVRYRVRARLDADHGCSAHSLLRGLRVERCFEQVRSVSYAEACKVGMAQAPLAPPLPVPRVDCGCAVCTRVFLSFAFPFALLKCYQKLFPALPADPCGCSTLPFGVASPGRVRPCGVLCRLASLDRSPTAGFAF